MSTLRDIVRAMVEWINYYNNERIKHKLKGKTPIEYRNLALRKAS
ncbi:IS3 family transposase [Limosilactobacillus sp.]